MEAKRLEFPDNVIGQLTGKTEREVKELRDEYDIHAAFKMVDTCAAEFAAFLDLPVSGSQFRLRNFWQFLCRFIISGQNGKNMGICDRMKN